MVQWSILVETQSINLPGNRHRTELNMFTSERNNIYEDHYYTCRQCGKNMDSDADHTLPEGAAQTSVCAECYNEWLKTREV